MDENLVGYLLKSLDPDEQREMERHLHLHPANRARLDLLERALQPLAADAEDPDPSPGLVLATLAYVAEHKCRPLPQAPPPSRHQVGSPGRRWFRRSDLLVAAMLLILIGGLCAPGLLRSWQTYQQTACAGNLARYWVSLSAYGDQHRGQFPQVEAQGSRSVAGIFIPILQDAGVLGEVNVLCPAQGQRLPVHHSARELQELYETRPEEFQKVAQDLSGSYAYSLGYLDGNTPRGLHRTLGEHHPILADRPLFAGPGNSPNHGGTGQNVLYIGGQVRWCTQRNVGPKGDDIYVNRNNQVLAGVNQEDSVLAPSNASPYPRAD